MSYKISRRETVDRDLKKYQSKNPQKYRQVLQTLLVMEQNPFDPQLRTTRYQQISDVPGARKSDRPMWHSRVLGPDAWRVHWIYGDKEDEIQIVDVIYAGPHL